MELWRPYIPGMKVAGKRIRIAGTVGQYNEVTNAFDKKVCRVPAGLEGTCELEVPQHAKLAFRKTDGENLHKWNQITGLTKDNIESGALFCYINSTRLRGLEVAG